MLIGSSVRFNRSRQIAARDPGIPDLYERLLNKEIVWLILGFCVGSLWLIGDSLFELYIRSQVLANSHVFTRQNRY